MILMVGIWDWANTGWRFKKCLESLGLEVVAFKGHQHDFKYPEEIPTFGPLARFKTIKEFPVVVSVPELQPFAEKADVIHMIASTYINPGVDLLAKNVVVQHSGVSYPLESEKANALFNPVADATILQFPGLMGYGAKNEHLIIYPIDEDFIRPDYEKKTPRLTIGHFPSNPITKGTEKVLNVIKKLKNTPLASGFDYVGIGDLKTKHHVSWGRNLERMRFCDVIIETVQDKVYFGGVSGQYSCIPNGNGSKPFGDWGNTCLEASALGKVVITNCIHKEQYESEYGCDFPCYTTNNEQDLELNLIKLILMDNKKLREEKQQHREWAVTNHGIKPTAERLWEKVYRNFCEGEKWVHQL